MIKIFIESGVNAAIKHDKETTNEQDFLVKVIAKFFQPYRSKEFPRINPNMMLLKILR